MNIVNNCESLIWKDVQGFEGIYVINQFGTVKSLPRTVHRSLNGDISYQGKTLKHVLRNGYPSVYLLNKYYLVHRLVAMAFVENPNNYSEINHKDENPLNCSYDNLEWCTHKYNINYGTRTKKAAQTISVKNTGKISPKRKKVFYKGTVYDSLTSFCKSFNKSLSVVSRWLNGKRSMPSEFSDGNLCYVEVRI